MELFVTRPDESLICAICHEVFDNPTTVCGEGHSFCAGCLCTMSAQSRCALCRSSLLDAPTINRPLQSFIGGLSVRCRNGLPVDASPDPKQRKREEGGAKVASSCTWVGKLDMVESHLKCCEYEFTNVPCPHDGCKETVRRNRIDEHASQCPHRLVSCTLCGKTLKARALRVHSEFHCPEAMTMCDCCEAPMLRKELGTVGGSSLVTRFCAYDEHDGSGRPNMTGHYAVCPRIKLRCEFAGVGCHCQSAREEMASHHAAAAREHARLTSGAIAELKKRVKDDTEWELMQICWKIPKANLGATTPSAHTLRSSSVVVAGKRMYLRLNAEGERIRVCLCTESPPNTSFVPINGVCVWVEVDDAAGFISSDWFSHDWPAFHRPSQVELTRPEGAQAGSDLAFECRLVGLKQGARIEHGEHGEQDGDESEYECEESEATCADLLAGDDVAVVVKAEFRVRKVCVCNVGCARE